MWFQRGASFMYDNIFRSILVLLILVLSSVLVSENVRQTTTWSSVPVFSANFPNTFRFNGSAVATPSLPVRRYCNVVNLAAQPQPFPVTIVNLTYIPSIKICIHPNYLKQDRSISGTIARGTVWESWIVDQMRHALRQDPSMGLLDIGANIGQYSLIAGKMGHQVVAVEALQRHVSMLHKSIQLNNIQDNVVLVHNALSNSRKTVSIAHIKGNYGGSFLVNSSSVESPNEVTNDIETNVPVQSIFMDDLLEVIPFKKAVLKMDIEGHEPYAILGGKKLFEEIQIPYIFMEFGQLTTQHYETRKDETRKMLTFLRSRQMVAYDFQWKPLPPDDFHMWPWDVYFKHQNATLPWLQSPA